MNNSIKSIQTAQVQAQTEQTVQPPKNLQTAAKASTPQDTVTISQSAKQALETNAKSVTSGDVNHDGNSR